MIRRSVAPWLVLAAIISITAIRSSRVAAEATATATVTSPDGLNLRDGPDTTHTILAVMPAGTTVNVTGSATADNWLPVQYNGQAGWADGAYLVLTAGTTTSAAAAAQASPALSPPPMPSSSPVAAGPTTSTAVVQPPDGLNLRSGPGTAYGVVTVIPGNAFVTITGPASDVWVPVSFDSQSGWVDGSYLAMSASVSTTVAAVPASNAATAATTSTTNTITSNAVTTTTGAALGAPAGSPGGTSATAATSSAAQYPLAWPGPSRRISTVFSPAHLGIDIDEAPTRGQPLGASAAGTVTFAGGSACCGYGLYVVVDHGNGMETLYAHLSSVAVRAGQTVTPGQNLGVSGCTGHCTGPHIHFEVHVNGKPADPLRYLPPPWNIE